MKSNESVGFYNTIRKGIYLIRKLVKCTYSRYVSKCDWSSISVRQQFIVYLHLIPICIYLIGYLLFLFADWIQHLKLIDSRHHGVTSRMKTIYNFLVLLTSLIPWSQIIPRRTKKDIKTVMENVNSEVEEYLGQCILPHSVPIKA